MNKTARDLFYGKRILIIGLGFSNVSLIKFLVSYKPKSILVTDLMNDPDEIEKVNANIKLVQEIFTSCQFVLGSHDGINLNNVDLAIKSPSICDDTSFVKLIRDQEIPIESDISIFFKLIPREKIIGVTGTKGKSTTCTLITQTLRDQGLKVTLSGNIGIPVLENFESSLQSDYAVVELSSFMISSLHRQQLSPRMMVITSLNQDHLDFHQSVAAYESDKLSILRDQFPDDLSYVSKDSKRLQELAPKYKVGCIFYSAVDLPETVTTSLRGKHYLSNISAAYHIGKTLLGNKWNQAQFEKTISTFKPLYSRMETRWKTDHIEFINNSKATNTDAFCADISTLIEENKSIYVLCGGEDKGLDLSEMITRLSMPQIKGLAVFNNTGGKRLVSELGEQKVVGYFSNVRDAFSRILREIDYKRTDNNVVILMPGTGTYGLFKNKDGSDMFNKCVEEQQLVKQ